LIKIALAEALRNFAFSFFRLKPSLLSAHLRLKTEAIDKSYAKSYAKRYSKGYDKIYDKDYSKRYDKIYDRDITREAKLDGRQ